MTTLRAETQVFQDERERHGSKLIGLKKAVDETQSVLTIAQNELSIYTSAEHKEKARLEQLEAGIKSSREQLQEKGARLQQLEKLLPAKVRKYYFNQQQK